MWDNNDTSPLWSYMEGKFLFLGYRHFSAFIHHSRKVIVGAIKNQNNDFYEQPEYQPFMSSIKTYFLTMFVLHTDLG